MVMGTVLVFFLIAAIVGYFIVGCWATRAVARVARDYDHAKSVGSDAVRQRVHPGDDAPVVGDEGVEQRHDDAA